MRWSTVVVVGCGLWALGCTGLMDSWSESVQQGVQEQVEKVDAAVQAEVRERLDAACAQQAGDNPRVHQVCSCVADELLESGDAKEILAKLDQPVELAKPYVEKCGALILESPEPAP